MVDEITVFVVDDHRVLREAVAHFLGMAEGIEVVGEAATAAEALKAIPEVLPDVALLDIRLPDGNGIEVCREIRSRCPEVRCLIFTGAPDEDSLMDSVVAGASGFIGKGVSSKEVVEAIRKVGTGGTLVELPSLDVIMRRIQERRPSAASLSTQERRVLELIGRGLTNRQIGEELHLAEQTVKNYVSALLSKLGFERRTQAAAFAARMPPEPPQHRDPG